MAEIEEIKRHLVRLDRNLERQIDLIEAEFEAWIGELLSEEEQEGDDYFILLAERVRTAQMPIEVIEAIEGVVDLYVDELRALSDRFAISPELAEITRELADAEVSFVEQQLQGVIFRIGGAIALGSRVLSRGEIKENIIGATFSRIETEIGTNLAGYRSAKEFELAEEIESEPRFRYVGVVDKNNRPFCAYVLRQDKTWTKKEIDQLDSRSDVTLKPVYIYGGGYNCRHRWIYVGEDE